MNLNKLYNYYIFRVKQFFRIINNDSSSVLIYFIFALIIYFSKIDDSRLFLIYYLIPSIYFLINRKDITFVKQTFTKKHYFVLFIEYLLLYFIVLILIFNKADNLIVHLLGFLFCTIYPLASNKKNEWTKNINLSYLPNAAFEWKTYIRSKPIFFITYFLIMLISSYHPFALGITIFLFCDIINSTYSIVEPKEIYRAYFIKNSINNKIFSSLLVINLITIIPFMSSLLINIDLYFIVLFLFLLLNMFSISTILYKYSNYDLNYSKIKTQNIAEILTVFILIFLILPWIINSNNLRKKVEYKISKYA
jgi:hypothetical protein